VSANGPDAAGEVDLFGGDVLPDAVDGIDPGLIAGEGGDIGDAGVHVTGAHGVADRLTLFQYGDVVLAVGAVEFTAAAFFAADVEQEAGGLEILFFTGDAVEFCQPHFDHLMAGGKLNPAGAESGANEVGALEGHIEEVALAGGLEMGGRGFVEMAHVVQFVAHMEFRPAALAAPLLQIGGVVGAGGIEITILLLGGGDEGDQAVQIGRQFFVLLHAEGVGGAFDDLVDIAVIEGVAALLPALERSPGNGKVGDAAGLFGLGEGVGDGDSTVGLDARRPELVFDMHAGERHRLDGIVLDPVL